jgi:hypothetical protein
MLGIDPMQFIAFVVLCYQQTYFHSYAMWIAPPLLGGTSVANDPVDYQCQDRPRGVQNHFKIQEQNRAL